MGLTHVSQLGAHDELCVGGLVSLGVLFGLSRTWSKGVMWHVRV